MPRRKKDTEVSDDNAVQTEETTPTLEVTVDYSVYPTHLRAHYRALDKAEYSVTVLDKRFRAKEEAFLKIQEEREAKLRGLQEKIVRARVMIASGDENERRIAEALAQLDEPADVDNELEFDDSDEPVPA